MLCCLQLPKERARPSSRRPLQVTVQYNRTSNPTFYFLDKVKQCKCDFKKNKTFLFVSSEPTGGVDCFHSSFLSISLPISDARHFHHTHAHTHTHTRSGHAPRVCSAAPSDHDAIRTACLQGKCVEIKVFGSKAQRLDLRPAFKSAFGCTHFNPVCLQ